MLARFISEPELEFGSGGRHIDVRFGLMNHGVLDYGESAAKQIRVALIGTNETIDGLRGWLDKCETGIDQDPRRRAHLAPRFPGFGANHTFYSEVVSSDRMTRVLTSKDVSDLVGMSDAAQASLKAAELFNEQIKQLKEEAKFDVALCALPFSLAEKTLSMQEGTHRSFRDALKALAMRHQTPTQVVLPPTYDRRKKLKRSTRDTERTLQDEATVAWNFFTALYYKAGGIPWRMRRQSSDFPTCYIGVSFFEDLERMGIETSLAQVFNERGEGVVVRGGVASVWKDDRHPYLEEKDALELLRASIERYKGTHGNLPARVVLHKTSPFRECEIQGFGAAISNAGIPYYEAYCVTGSTSRIMRDAEYPPLRGSMLEMSANQAILYTKGSVEFFQTYPGVYIPSPLHLTAAQGDSSFHRCCTEIMALSKMNWNQTQFDGRLPITVGAARQVGKVLRYLGGGESAEASYRFYM